MMTKLTLSMESSVIQKAKAYAGKTGQSLSNLIENYLESLVEDRNNREAGPSQLPPKLRRLYGAASIPASLDHKKEIRKILTTRKNK
jgi:hypothetical protein